MVMVIVMSRIESRKIDIIVMSIKVDNILVNIKRGSTLMMIRIDGIIMMIINRVADSKRNISGRKRI